MTVDQQVMDSANYVKSLDLCDVLMSCWVAEETSESKVDKKDLAQPVTGTYHEIVWFNIKMNVIMIMQYLRTESLE
jgi:hypothetical protein